MTSRNRRPGRGRGPAPEQPQIDRAQVEQHVNDVRNRLKRAGRPDVAGQKRKSLGADVSCYGVKPPDVHQIGLDALRRVRSAGLPMTIAIAGDLFSTGNVEEGIVGAQMVASLARLVTGNDFDAFDRWANGLTNAQTADALGTSCISPAMAAKPSIALRLQDWAKAESPWRRCAALAAFVPVVREGRFLTDALSVAELVMTDEHEDVQRAVGTMLMEAARLQADRVVEFLKMWKDRSPKLLLQTAATKLGGEQRTSILGR